MGIIQDITNRFSGSLTDDQKDELYDLLKNMKPEDLVTIEEHKLYIEMLAKLRMSLMRGMRLMGEKFLKTLESLLSVGEDGVYSNSFRFLYELIQNVDDCDYDDVSDCHLDVRFCYNDAPGRIILTYNEKGFKPENVFAITGIAEASKNISADKVEIGEKGIGFKSVFGIAKKVLIQSGMFSFELTKENFTVPVPHYNEFTPVNGTRLELQMSTYSCKSIFVELVKEYRSKDSLLNKNPILFLNKLTHLKMYFDNYKYIEFDVQRSEPERRGILQFESNTSISVDMQYRDSSFNVDHRKEEIRCYRYTMPVDYKVNECRSRYGEDTPFLERHHNIIAVFPIFDVESPITRGVLYSFLPTQVKTNSPIIIHVPFKLDSSREFVDPQGNNTWFKYTIQKLSTFIRTVYVDLAHIVREKIITYIPKCNEYLFYFGNEKVKCLCVRELSGKDILREKLFYTTNGVYENADNVVAFNSKDNIDNPECVWKLLGITKNLFVPANRVNMSEYGCEIINNVSLKLFTRGLKNESIMGEALDWIEHLEENVNYPYLVQNCGQSQIELTPAIISAIGAHEKFKSYLIRYFGFLIKQSPMTYKAHSSIMKIPNERSEEIKSLIEGADLKSEFLIYLERIGYTFFAADSTKNFVLVAENGVILRRGAELESLSILASQFDPNHTLTAALQLRHASELLNQADESMDNSKYLKLLRSVQSDLKKAFGDRKYNNHVRFIIEAGIDKNRFLDELLQNADDCEYVTGVEPEFILKQTKNIISITYNEVGFTKANVRAITDIGQSTKSLGISGRDRTIGEKGVGFKSVFGVAEQVEIHSNGFNFILTDRQPTIPEKCAPINISSGTMMIFKMKTEVQNGFSTERILKLCMCLHKLRHIVIANHEVTINDDAESGKRFISVDGREYTYNRFVYDFNVVDEEALAERKKYGRGILPNQQIILYIPEKGKEQEYFVYSGLPTETKSNVPLIIDAPFELTTSREGILHNRWNEIIREEMYNAILSFMRSISSSGLDILKYVGFKSQNKVITWGNFENDYLNQFNWVKALKCISFIPVAGTDQFLPLSQGSFVLVPEFISRVAEDALAFSGNVVNITGKSQYVQLLEAIGCRRANGSEIYGFLQRYVQENIVEAEFRKGLYAYLSNNQGNYAFELIGDDVLHLPIFPVKMSSGIKYISYSPSLYYSHDKSLSQEDYYILDTEIMGVGLADRILGSRGRINALTQEVFDAKYQKNLEDTISNRNNRHTPQDIAEYLLKEYENNWTAINKCRNSLLGMKTQIPLRMADGQFKTGKKYLNRNNQWFGGTVIKRLIVDQAYYNLADFLELEDICNIHSEAFDFDIDDISNEDISDVQYLNNYYEIIKYFMTTGLISDEQIATFHLEFAEGGDDSEICDLEDFPEKRIANINRLKNHILEQWCNKNPYIEKNIIRWQPRMPFDNKTYIGDMYRSDINTNKCFCQMCQEKYDIRYIERNDIEKSPAYAWDQMFLSLCLHCSKDYILLRNNSVVWDNFITQIMSTNVMERGVIEIPIANRSIAFTATHLAEVQEIFKTQGWGTNTPKRKSQIGTTEIDEE